MSAILIRNFVPEDQDNVAELYSSGQDANIDVPDAGISYKWFVNTVLKPGGDMRNIQGTYVEKNPGKNCFLLAELDGKLVGCVAAMPTTKYSEDHVELLRMCVSGECRGMGVGAKLLHTLETWAKEAGYRKVYLSTLSGFIAANIFYRKHGFHVKETQDIDAGKELNLEMTIPVTVNHYVKNLDDAKLVGTNE
jgi:N-acetylglutamate synthase-like GNAT family acetyltransferase